MTIPLVIMAGGVSRRYDYKNKLLAQVSQDGRTCIDVTLEQATKVGITDYIFIVGEKTEAALKSHLSLKHSDKNIRYAFQPIGEGRAKPAGTADAFAAAIDQCKIETPCILINGDDICSADVMQELLTAVTTNPEQSYSAGFLLKNVLPEDPETTANRGVILTDSEGNLTGMREELDISWNSIIERGLNPETLISLNVFAFSAEFSERFLEVRNEEFPTLEADKELFLPDTVAKVSTRFGLNLKVVPVPEGKWFGITYPGDEIEVQKRIDAGEII